MFLKNKPIIWSLLAATVLAAFLFFPNWKSSTDTITKKKQSDITNQPSADKAITEDDFLKSVFEKTKAPDFVQNAVLSTTDTSNLSKSLAWAVETNNVGLFYYLTDKRIKVSSDEKLQNQFAREAIFNAVSLENQNVGKYIAQLAKKYIDEGLQKKPNQIELLNARIIYESQFLNQPMQFLATLRQTLSLDSLNEETNLIHINLLKTSNQMQKALDKCKKLVSLQPQKPLWLFQTSETLAMMGDSIGAKTYLNLATKQIKSKKIK